MTVAELALPYIMSHGEEEFTGAKISRIDILPEDVETVKSFLGKKYALKDLITGQTFIFDLRKAKIENNTLVYDGDKPNFYKV